MILDKSGRARGFSAKAALTLTACWAAFGCGSPTIKHVAIGNAPIPVVVTISTIASLANSVGGDRIAVSTVVPIGASPETYDPRPQDLVAISRARLIIENGAGLESWLQRLVRNAAPKGTQILVLSSGMPVAGRAANDRAGLTGNPHLWLDPIYAQAYVKKIAAALQRIDPQDAAYFAAREKDELRRLTRLDVWIRRRVARVPEQRRAAIVFHDAWFYFDRRYGIRDVGVVEPTPGQDPSAAYFSRLIADAKNQHVTAIFGEPQYSSKLIHQLGEAAGVHETPDLYDDTVGTTPALSSYEGVMRYDVDKMVEAMTS